MQTRSTPFDIIVVLGAALGAGGRPTAILRGRVAEGLRQYRDGKAEILLLSGGKGNGGPSEAEVMAALAREAGVSEAHLVLETNSASTLENALYSARIMAGHGWTRALVVTDRVHLPRALLAFHAAGVTCQGAAVPGYPRGVPLWTWPFHLTREAIATLWYAVLIATGAHRRRKATLFRET